MTQTFPESVVEDTWETWDDLRADAEAAGGVLHVAMWQLRDLENAGRLGVHVRSSISRKLLGIGLAHLPAELPANQEQSAVLYKLGTPAASVVEAIRGEDADEAAAVLRRLNTSRDAQKLQEITEKVAELAELVND